MSELLSRTLKQKNIPHNVLNAKQHSKEAQIVTEAGVTSAVTIATNMAGRGTDIKLGPGVKDAGGLAIIGTERHESRRVDRQLRGRAGRQGDPGRSQFFVSMEDDLMRIFGSERLDAVLSKLGMKEGEAIVHPWVNKSLERAQAAASRVVTSAAGGDAGHLAEAIVELQAAKLQAAASAKVVRAADESLGTLLDVMPGEPENLAPACRDRRLPAM